MVLEGERVVLRPFREDEYDAIWEQWRGDNPHPPGAKRRAVTRMRRSGEFHDGWLNFALETEGRLAGDAQARRPKGALPPGVFELGITLFNEADRGRGLGTEAIRLLTDHLFAGCQAERVQGSTWVENAAMRCVFERLGFQFEGVMRGFLANESGGRDDYALYGVTRGDWM